MKLESLTVELRPRSGWEAMELGSALVRRHAAAIWTPWLWLTLPVFAMLCAGAWALGSVALAWIAMWWLRPVFDRIPVYVLSRAVFGTVPSTGETLRAQMRWGWRTMVGHLTWRRFSPLRAVTLPIDLLEGADGALLSERRRIIGAGASGHAVQLTLMCSLFIVTVQVSLLLLILLFVPNEKVPELIDATVGVLGQRPPEWFVLLLLIADYTAMTLIEPFYIGGGFGLYLNRRTQLEAWDVEIAFRRMRKRIEAGTLGALLLLTACWPLLASAQTNAPPTLQTQPAEDNTKKAPPPDDDGTITPEEIAADVTGAKKDDHSPDDEEGPPPRELASIFGENTAEHDAFGQSVERAYEDENLRPKRRSKIWQRRDPLKPGQPAATPELEWLGNLIAFVGEYGLWLLAGGALLALLLTAKRWWPWLRTLAMPGEPEPIAIEVQAAEHAEPLPPDIAASARRLWREGQPRRALALLYRASVEAMVARAGMHLPPGATEAECLRLARRMPEADDRTAFQQMVRIWQYAAYGQRLPEETDFETILQTLVQRFGWRA
jgi:Domain of unknown function (DUF4129)